MKMINVITCPVDKSTIKEYSFDDDISAVVDEHMIAEHHDWFKTRYVWLPRDGAHCPICDTAYLNVTSVDHHVRMSHRDYEKVDILEYRLKEGNDARPR